MRIMITGGCGFIGSNLVRQMVEAGHDVLNVDKLTYAGNRQSLADIELNAKYSFSQIDIVDFESLRASFANFKPDAVMHLAAESHVDRSIDSPGEFVQTNVIGTMNLLNASLEHFRSLDIHDANKFRVLHVSTDEVYGSLGSTGAFSELTRYDPHSPYSASKAASDHLARAWCTTYGLPVIVTNCSNNYGPFQFPEKLIPVVILKCLFEETIPVYGTGENVRDWLYVDDHCRALQRVLHSGEPGTTYNIGGSNELSNIELVKKLCGVLDDLRPRPQGGSYRDLISFVKDRPGHDFRYAIDASKIQRELGWKPLNDCDSGLLATVQWYLDNESWWRPLITSKDSLKRMGTRK
jgi:dTDP-glucose 4,6-dehydratase